MNITVLCSGGGTNLQALINAQKAGELGGGVITRVICSNSGAYALTRAENNNIPTRVLERGNYENSAEYSAALLKLLREEDTDLIICAGFMTIFDGSICRAYANKMINVHPSLIPSFCGKGYYGLNVHKAVLERGVKITGATVHFMTEECDCGPIILQKAVEVKNNDTPEMLQKRVMEQAEWIILPQAAKLFCENKIVVENGKAFVKG